MEFATRVTIAAAGFIFLIFFVIMINFEIDTTQKLKASWSNRLQNCPAL
ncbi:MAG: hypothetical protein N4A70_14335 [Pelagimonas sp.]|nr:hypothetical protein [Pelagimonas sp.]